MGSLIFGPVPSRRLGRSLGVDLVPFKTCSYDCIYCQLGPTTCKTVERKEWVPLDKVLDGLEPKLSTHPDYITLSGSGEPTLYSRTGELIERIKAMTEVPVAVLTNGSLLWQEEVRDQIAGADLVVPSLDAGEEEAFHFINRPHEEITFARMLEGLIAFRREFRGEYWLEILVLDPHTSSDAGFAKLIECVGRIQPNRVQLNTVTRPPAEDYAVGVSGQRLSELASRLDPPGEVVADFRGVHKQVDFVAGREEILDLLRRRPCSLDDIAEGLGMHRNEVVKYVEELSAADQIENMQTAGKIYYQIAESKRE